MMNEMRLEKVGFFARLKSMLTVDFHRMLVSKLFYIILLVSLLVPIVMTVMLVMMDGAESVNQSTGEVTIIEGPESVWETIGTIPTDTSVTDNEASATMGADMDVLALCNINMAFMGVAVFVCLFISSDFRSGFAKNMFTTRCGRGEYVISKTIVGFVTGALMLILYFVGAMLAGVITSLSFALGSLTPLGILMCMLAKIALMLVFISIFVLVSIAAKSRAWLSILCSLSGGMLLFMVVGMVTPLNSTPMHLLLCFVGGVIFAVGLGAISRAVIRGTSVV